MRKTLGTVLILFAAALTASATSEEIFKRQMNAAPGEKLVVDVDCGEIDLAPGADDKVEVEAFRKIEFSDEAKEKEYLANAPITATKEGNVVTIRERGKKPDSSWRIGYRQLHVKYTIRIPKKFEVDLQTDGGRINARDIAGNFKAHTSGGGMIFAHLEGALDAETSGGAIELDDCRGPLDVETSGGHIKVTEGKGSLKAHTSGGHIEVRDFSGDTEVRTSGGSLDLEKIAGKLIGKTSGGAISASIPAPVLGDIKLETSAGSVDLAVPASAALTIDAKTSVGEVVSHLPIQASDLHRDRLHGTLNGGGKSVSLETSAGNIVLKPISGEVANR